MHIINTIFFFKWHRIELNDKIQFSLSSMLQSPDGNIGSSLCILPEMIHTNMYVF